MLGDNVDKQEQEQEVSPTADDDDKDDVEKEEEEDLPYSEDFAGYEDDFAEGNADEGREREESAKRMALSASNSDLNVILSTTGVQPISDPTTAPVPEDDDNDDGGGGEDEETSPLPEAAAPPPHIERLPERPDERAKIPSER